jgi:hypothetical protein
MFEDVVLDWKIIKSFVGCIGSRYSPLTSMDGSLYIP